MNILYHHRTQGTGAAGHHIREMVKAFRKHGYSVDILSPPGVENMSEEKTGSQKKNRYLVPQIIFELLEIGYNLIDFVRLARQLKKKKYDFLYERYSIFNVVGILASRRKGIPIIIEASFTSKTSVYPKRTRILGSLACAVDKFIFNRAEGIVVVSSVLKYSLIKDFKVTEEKILVLPNAVDTDFFDPSMHNDAIKRAYGFESKQVVGFVGGFYPWHGLDLLIDAAREVIKVLPDTKFFLVGDGPDKKSLEDRVSQSHLKNSVIFTGSVPYAKVAEHIAAFDIGVMPDSNDYGSPIKIFEYMAMGKPVLAPRIGPIEEVIDDGKDGLLFTRHSKEGLSQAIVRILTDRRLYNAIAVNSQKEVIAEHTWFKNAGSILDKWKDHLKTRHEIKFVLQYFHPEVASTAQLMTELAESLVDKGFKVAALVGQPSYADNDKLARNEVYNGIKIERVSSTQFDKNSSLGRLLNWFSFTVLAFLKLLFSKDKTPLFIVSTPPFLFVVGYLLNILQGRRYVCLVYDLYPDIAERLGYIKKNNIIYKIWDRCNKSFFRRAEYIIVPSEAMKDLIDEKVSIPRNDKVKVIYNWADGSFLKPLDKKDNWFSRKYGFTNKLTVLYAGNIGLFHQLETLIEAADKLRNNKNIQFVFIGEGGKKPRLEAMVREKQLDNVLFLPYQDKSALPYSLTSSDVSVVSLEKKLDCVAAPCKLYTSMASGQIILGLVDKNSDVAQIVSRGNCGFCCEQDDVDGVVAMLKKLCNDSALTKTIKLNSRKYFEENFEKDKLIWQYAGVFLKLNKKGEDDDQKNSISDRCGWIYRKSPGEAA